MTRKCEVANTGNSSGVIGRMPLTGKAQNMSMSCHMPDMSSCELFFRKVSQELVHMLTTLKVSLLACDHLTKHELSSVRTLPSQAPSRATCHRRVRVTWLPDTSLCDYAVHWCEPKSHTKPSCGYKFLIRQKRRVQALVYCAGDCMRFLQS